MTDRTKLVVRVGTGDRTRREARERIRALERDEDVEDRHVLVLADETELHRLLSPANLQLLRAIREHEPESMREAADVVDRDFKEVHRNLTELEALNIVEFVSDGRAKRPIVRFDDIDIEVSLDAPDAGQAPA